MTKVRGKYGPELKKDDIIQVCLDLKDNYELSYVVNDQRLGKAFDVKKETAYKLAISLYVGRMSLLSYKVTY